MSDQPTAVDALVATTEWQGIGLPKLPPELTAALDGISALGSTATAALQVLADLLDVIANLSISTDVVKEILRAAIRAIEDGLSALLNDTGAYVLYVPVRRQIVVSPLIQEALSITGIDPPKNKTYDAKVLEAKLTANNPRVAEFFKRPADGGNAGFVRTVAESITDQKDPNRPMFGPSSYVGGIHVLAGASDYVNLLSLLTALDGFLVPPGSKGLSVAGFPVPQNLKGQSVRLLTGELGARLSWDAQIRTVLIPPLASGCVITQVAIIRSKDPKVISATSPEGLFGTRDLTVGKKTSDGKTEVISILETAQQIGNELFSLPTVPVTYDDNTGTLEAGTPYYYFASFNLKVGPLEDVANAESYPQYGFYRLSNVCTVTPQVRSTRSGKGTPPDWIRTPSIVDMIPAAGDLLTLLIATLRQFEASLSANTDAIKQYIAFLQNEIARLKTLLEQISGIINRLTSILSQTPSVGIYGRTFGGKGGVDFMLSDLAFSLSPQNTDPGRPPFDRGDEFVTGAVVLVGGPSEDGIAAVIAMIEALFGLGASAASSPLTDAIASIDAVVTAQETASFSADFSVGAAPATEQSLTGDVPLSDSDPGSCAADTTPTPTFGDDLGVTS